MSPSQDEFDSCAVCGRTILRGEQAVEYVDDQGDTVLVCPLCKQRAETSGWLPAAYAASVPRPEPRRRGAAALRERIARGVATVRPPAEERAADEEEEAPARPPDPLEVFNASSEVRKVSGLRRSLGEPRVCVRRDGRGGGRVITVAWDLSWYRWTVQGTSVKQVAKGNEISELPVEDRDWNATAGEDGTLVLD